MDLIFETEESSGELNLNALSTAPRAFLNQYRNTQAASLREAPITAPDVIARQVPGCC